MKISLSVRFVIFGIMLLSVSSFALAAIVSDIRASKHNFSAVSDGSVTPTGTVPVRTVKATSEKQVCVFCHTPHSSTTGLAAPLWNRALSSTTYTAYLSSSIDASPLPTQPGTGSKMCLSCHDGTLAIGMVSVLNGTSNVAVDMAGTQAGGEIPVGSGTTTGFTRHLGIDLSNDHPISFAYDNTLGGPTGTDGELRALPVVSGATTVVDNRTATVKPIYPLSANQMQCTTCHDAHLSDTNAAINPPLKFLRGNRLQQQSPTGGSYVEADDIMCLACHDKAGTTWSNSAHANSLVASQAYLDAAANLREFPDSVNGPTEVWEASCLNCHDTHSVQGSRRLLREATDSVLSPKAGGSSAMEETCFQCHSALGTSILTPLTQVPDIKSDFAMIYRMPINDTDQGVTSEVHDIGGNFDDSFNPTSSGAPVNSDIHCNIPSDRCGKDFVESQALLGRTTSGVDLTQRHAECSDCHNPHRVTKTRLFNADATPPILPDAAGTHKHAIAPGDLAPHDNIASGSLRGMTGVEPSYSSNEFGTNPSTFNMKRGDVGASGASTAVSSTHLTREYQVCFKCHSNYAYDTAVGPPTTVVNTPLSLGTYGGGTTTGTNGMTYYNDTAMEFQAPVSHQGTPASTTDSGASLSTNNYRSWHPVMDATGRTVALRGATANLWRAPWNGSNTDTGSTIVAAVGTQTMYCSDCHGSDNSVTYTTDAVGSDPENGEDGKSWGPHGSNNAFLLRGNWDTAAAIGTATDTLCFRCHDASQYADPAVAPVTTLASGFGHATNLDPLDGTTPLTNLHQRHAYYATGPVGVTNWPTLQSYRCTLCHTGTAHGWKNKAFLVNLDDLGLELNSTGGAIGGETPGPLLAGAAVPKGSAAPASATSPLATAAGYTNGPYYQGAFNRVSQFAASGNWIKTDCTGGCH